MKNVRKAFTVSTEALHTIETHLLSEMEAGLENTDASTVKMLRSFVHKRPTDTVNGDFFALDLGGTNFRVLKLTLDKGKVTHKEAKAFKIPKEQMEGNAESLFGFIASSVASVVPKEARDSLGFTFSFPVQQVRIDSGKLISWTKGFTASGVEGEDVVKLLQVAFNHAGLQLNIVALVNDTVGTLVTEYFKDETAAVGMILGTGANACYWEKVKNIPKHLRTLDAGAASAVTSQDEMVINMECGNFDSHAAPRALPRTPYDQQLDQKSPNPGRQFYEKMLSGMYLGELCRLVLCALQQRGVLPAAVAGYPGFHSPHGFETSQMSLCLADTSANLDAIEAHLLEKYGLKTAQLDRARLRAVCELVARRSARLAAAGVVTVVSKMGVQRNCTVSIDGSVFEKVPGYKAWMDEAIREMFGSGRPYQIRLVLTHGGSGVGAGLIAALAVQDP